MRIFNAIVLVSFVLLCGACKVMYLPTMQNVPMFREKGEFQASIAAQNLQVAYSATEQVGVIINGYKRKNKVPTLDDEENYNYMADSYGIDFGIGYLKNGDEGNEMEVYGGYGFGRASLSYENDAPISSGGGPRGGSSHYNKFFIQPVFINRNDDLDFGFSVRVSMLDFYDFQDELDEPLEVDKPIFLEPALTLSKHLSAISLRAQFQYSFATGSAGNNFGTYSPYKSKTLMNFGVTINLEKLN